MHSWSKWIAASCLVIGLSTVASADVTGKVTLEGDAPDLPPVDMSAVKECAACHPNPVDDPSVTVNDHAELKNVVVYLRVEDGKTAPGGDAASKPPATAAVIDQKGCMYEPHVTAVMAGQKITLKNSDPTLHNVNTTAATVDENKANQGMPKGASDWTYTPKGSEEPFKIKCDVHPWMSAWVAVFDHPYFSVTGDDGTFKITNLPDGEYTLEAWHERFGKKQAKVTVKDGKATVDFKFKADDKPAKKN